MPGTDNLTLGSGTQQDAFALGSGTQQDNLSGQYYTLAAEAGTLSGTPIDIDVDNAEKFASGGGSAILRNRDDGQEKTFTYTGKTGNTLLSCVAESGSLAFAIGDQIETTP